MPARVQVPACALKGASAERLASRVDVAGTTGFGYDRLNRPTGQTQPAGTTLASSYDGAEGLLSYNPDPARGPCDVVNYTYNAANHTKVVDAVGTYTINPDPTAAGTP